MHSGAGAVRGRGARARCAGAVRGVRARCAVRGVRARCAGAVRDGAVDAHPSLGSRADRNRVIL